MLDVPRADTEKEKLYLKEHELLKRTYELMNKRKLYEDKLKETINIEGLINNLRNIETNLTMC